MVYQSARYDPALACALVEYESWFKPGAERRYTDGSSDHGLFQLNSRWHPQYRDNLAKHIWYGSGLLLCKLIEYKEPLWALSAYHTNDPWKGLQYAQKVLSIYERIRRIGR